MPKLLYKDSVTYLIARIIPALLSLFYVLIYYRILNNDIFAYLTLTQTACNILGLVFATGVGQSILRYRTKYLDKDIELFHNSLNIHVFYMSILIFIVNFILVYQIIKLSWHISIYASFISILSFRYNVRMYECQSLLQPKKLLSSELMRVGLNLVVPICLLTYVKLNLWVLLSATLLGLLVANFLLSRGGYLRIIPQKLYATQHLKIFNSYGLPMIFWAATSQLLVYVDRYLLLWLTDLKSVAIYSALYYVVYNGFALLLSPFDYAAQPYIMNSVNAGKFAQAKRYLRDAILCQALIIVTVISILYFTNKNLSHLILGVIHPMAAKAVIPIALGSFLWQLAMLTHKPIQIAENSRRLFVYVVFALLINIIFNIAWIPRYNYLGAAYATLLSAFCYVFITTMDSLINHKKYFN